MKAIGRWTKLLCLVGVISGASTTAFADEYTARYDQYLLNGDSVLNGAVLSGAWQSSFTSSFLNELGVMERPRTDYDAKGLPLGGFRLFPVVAVAGGLTSNIFATSSGAESADFFEVDPSLALRSQWGRDSLNFYGGAQTTIYDKYTSENMTNWDVGSSGRLDILGDTDLRANVYYDALHEPRTSPNEPGNVARPTAFGLFHSDAAIDHKPNRLGITVGAAYDAYNYQNTPLVGGGFLNNSGRNEDIYTVYGRATYDFSPGYTAFIGGSYEDRHFLQTYDINGDDRSSDGYHIDAGTQFFISHLVQGQVFLGYLDQTFRKTLTSNLPDISALDYGANINWYATPMLTVHFGAVRTIDDTTIAGSSASDDQTVYASADYELLRDVLVSGQVGYLDEKFVGIARTDKVPTANVSVTWLLNHNFSLNAQYGYNERDSNVLGAGYTQNVFMLGLKAQL